MSTIVTGRLPYQKEGKPTPKPRKRMPAKSQKRMAYERSAEGKAGREWMGRVKQLPCVVCGKPGPSDAHHVIHGRYSTKRASDFDTIPLCKTCHQDGPAAIHNGKETWAAKNGPDYSFLPAVAAQLGEIEF